MKRFKKGNKYMELLKTNNSTLILKGLIKWKNVKVARIMLVELGHKNIIHPIITQ